MTNQYINYLTDIELAQRPNCEKFVTQMIFFSVILQTALCSLLERQIYRCWFLSAQATVQFFEKEQDTERETMKEASCYSHKQKKKTEKKKNKENKRWFTEVGGEKANLYKVQ